mgnify:CR=1 FL=1
MEENNRNTGMQSENSIFSEGIDVNEFKKGYKLYNFRRPDKFAKDTLRALQDIHREFSKQISMLLTGYLRMKVNVDVVSVDQLTYDEFVNSMPPSMSVGIFEFNPLPGQILFGITYEVLSCIVDRMLGGKGDANSQYKELTDVETSLTKKIIDIIVKTLNDSWTSIVPVEYAIVGLENGFQSVQVAAPGEIVALLTFEIQVNEKTFGLASLCFPYPVLETVLGHLSTQHIFQTKGLVASNDERLKMISKINTSNVDLRVQFGQCSITLDDFLQLSEGDIIKLDNKVQDDLIVKVNGEKKFFARPGTMKDKICVKITDVYDEMHELLRNYF